MHTQESIAVPCGRRSEALVSRFSVVCMLAIGLCLALGCTGGNSRDSNGGKLNVVCTVGMVADIARNVGGDHVEVTQLLGSGVDPHMHSVNRDDVSKLMSADVVFYCGLMLEGKMGDTLDKLSSSQTVVAVTDQLPASSLFEDGVESSEAGEAGTTGSGHPDPHVWMDVSLWAECINRVTETLCEADPAHRSAFEAAAEEYRQRLAELHEYGKTCMKSIPEENRVLITSHDAFNYFGRAYGIDVLGVQGISTESEAGLQRINTLVDTIVDRKIKAIFTESSVAAKSIEALAEGARGRGQEVVVSPKPLFSDAMGKAGTYEGTYIGMLDHNITIVTLALGGEAPARGMLGKLSGE